MLQVLESGSKVAKTVFETGEAKKNLKKENEIQLKIYGVKEGVQLREQ